MNMKSRKKHFPIEFPQRGGDAESTPITDISEDDFTLDLNQRLSSGIHITSFGDITEVIATEPADTAEQTTREQQM